MVFQELRNKLLQKAITGQLVPQLDSEPMVEQLGPAPKPEEVPFAIPDKWKWVRLGQLLVKSPKVVLDDEQEASFVPMENVAAGFCNKVALTESRCWREVKKKYTNFADGDVIIAKISPCFQNRKSALIQGAINGVACGSSEFFVLRCLPQLLNEYLLWFVKSAYVIQYGVNSFKGSVGQQRVGRSHLYDIPLPLPPLAEQKRIVAKLKPLLEELDAMERAYTELSGPMYAHFKDLILQKAISGKLVPQLDSEPAVEQLGPAPKAEEVPFAIPEKWKWVALEDLFQFVDYRGKTPIKSASGVRLITSSNVRKGYLDHTRCEYISIDEYQSRQSRGVSHKGDILFTTEAPLGNVALADLDVFSVGQRVITLKSKGLALNECFVWFLLSNYFQTEILKQATGSTVQGIKAARLKKLVLPLPPIEEQKRIAARINKLFAEADKLLALKELSL